MLNASLSECDIGKPLGPSDLHTGDLLFFQGPMSDPECGGVRLATGSMWSHVGMAIFLCQNTLETLRAALPKCRAVVGELVRKTYDDTAGWQERKKKLLEMMLTVLTLKNNVAIQNVVRSEGNNLIKKSKSAPEDDPYRMVTERSREEPWYLWEATTSEQGCALLSGVLDAKSGSVLTAWKGVRLSAGRPRVLGYEAPIGVRRCIFSNPHMRRSEISDHNNRFSVHIKSSSKMDPLLTREDSARPKCSSSQTNIRYEINAKRDTEKELYFSTLLYGVFASMCMNYGKGYEQHFDQLTNAWAYGGTCFTGDDCCSAMLREAFACCCCFACFPSTSSPTFHEEGESCEFYCSELCYQTLACIDVARRLRLCAFSRGDTPLSSPTNTSADLGGGANARNATEITGAVSLSAISEVDFFPPGSSEKEKNALYTGTFKEWKHVFARANVLVNEGSTSTNEPEAINLCDVLDEWCEDPTTFGRQQMTQQSLATDASLPVKYSKLKVYPKWTNSHIL